MKELVEVLETIAQKTRRNNDRIVKLERQTEKLVDDINEIQQQIRKLKNLVEQYRKLIQGDKQK
jgi:cell division protein FtsB